MSLTRDFRETVRARIQRDPEFREALLRESQECMDSGDTETGISILSNYFDDAASSGAHRRRASLARHSSPEI